jgi:hypothetical protein
LDIHRSLSRRSILTDRTLNADLTIRCSSQASNKDKKQYPVHMISRAFEAFVLCSVLVDDCKLNFEVGREGRLDLTRYQREGWFICSDVIPFTGTTFP